MEWEQREEHFKKPDICGKSCRLQTDCRQYESKKRPSKLPEEWEVIPNTHEGIVTQEEFDIVQQLITSRRLPQNKGGFVNILQALSSVWTADVLCGQ